MLSKRDFMVQSAALGAVLSTSPSIAWSAQTPIATTLIDARYQDAHRFAAALAERGADILHMGADLSALWQGPLPQLLAKPMAMHNGMGHIAGMGTYADFMLIRSLAAEHGKRVLFEGHHDCRGSQCLTHRLQFSAAAPRTLDMEHDNWPATLATILPQLTTAGTPQNHTITSSVKRAADHPGYLVSWMIGSI